MTAPSLLDELEGVVRLSERATPGPWGVCVGKNISIAQLGVRGPRIANCNYDNGPIEDANAKLIAHAVNFLRTRHAEIADMAKRMETAERDAFKWQLLCADCDDAGEGNRAAINVVNDACRLGSGALERHYGQAARDGLDAAIAVAQEGEE